ncbi:hypothetical protein QBC36DRAFT_127299 [Triangularia setosa]|uniref:Uncharacterized protein n=1 Tax=Triangularia setosa TaxID=2587417 RepID=A0AAN7A927_9PEZI|nr:hypothetical protein QBC36DRAFT_127299 [Podospora setosa]
MGGLDNDIPIPDIPIHVYVVIGCVASLLAGSQLIGFWLIGFKKPTPTEPVYTRHRTLHDSPSCSTLASIGDFAIRVPPTDARKFSGGIRRSVEANKLQEIREPEKVEEIKETGDTKGCKETGEINESKEIEKIGETSESKETGDKGEA